MMINHCLLSDFLAAGSAASGFCCSGSLLLPPLLVGGKLQYHLDIIFLDRELLLGVAVVADRWSGRFDSLPLVDGWGGLSRSRD